MIYACPFNYIGGKSKLLPTLLPMLSGNADSVFVDLFGGGFSVGLNVENRTLIYNDINVDLTKLIQLIQETPFDVFEANLLKLIHRYELSKINSQGYLNLRSDFNDSRDSYLFCLLIFYSFNHQIRYNGNHQFNTPFGKNRSSYNTRTQEKLRIFSDIIHTKQITFSSKTFQEVDIPSNAIVYIDPPYLITTGSYNDGDRGVSRWNESSERALYAFIDSLDKKSIPFVLSNMLKKGDYINSLLSEWKEGYEWFEVSTRYRNYQREDYQTQEIIVTNMSNEGRND
ncbi:MAG: Dam family site-specific DNA-(adenine-N6)-methyltransferase [Candidatus Woesebacteria bacterium]|jgi:DNA adenine methylase